MMELCTISWEEQGAVRMKTKITIVKYDILENIFIPSHLIKDNSIDQTNVFYVFNFLYIKYIIYIQSALFLDETSKWTDSYFNPGSFKTRRREMFFEDPDKSWIENASSNNAVNGKKKGAKKKGKL